MKKFLLLFIVLLFPVSLFAEEKQFDDGLPPRDAWKFTDDVPTPPTIDQVPVEKLDEAVLHGVQLLLKSQNRDGSWGLPIHTKKLNIYVPDAAHTAYRAGTTALALESLLRVERLLQESPKKRVLPEKSVRPALADPARLKAVPNCKKLLTLANLLCDYHEIF